MRLAVTGASGQVGGFVLAEARARGDIVTALGRTPVAQAHHRPFSLGETPDLSGIDALVHCALAHLPGRYRGGEGDDPDGFRRANEGGTERLLRAAEAAGVGRVVFLSSRAVYGTQPPGAVLTEETPCFPDTLYGEVKHAGEAACAAARLPAVCLRATGVYGRAGQGPHKWAGLFARFAAGEEIEPRIGTEVHGEDLAAAIRLALTIPQGPDGALILNVSDLLLDRADLLAEWAAISGIRGRIPPRADASRVNEMATGRLRALGWRPGGRDRLRRTLRDLAA